MNTGRWKGLDTNERSGTWQTNSRSKGMTASGDFAATVGSWEPNVPYEFQCGAGEASGADNVRKRFEKR